MILTFQSDGVLCVYQSVRDAVCRVEALDVEETFEAVFDETGEVYAIEWIKPNERGVFLVANGEYTLVPQHRKDSAALLRALNEARSVEPPEAHALVADLRGRLRRDDRHEGP